VQGLSVDPWAVEWHSYPAGYTPLRVRALCRGRPEASACDIRDGGYEVHLDWMPQWDDPTLGWVDEVQFDYTGPLPVDWDITFNSAGFSISWDGLERQTFHPNIVPVDRWRVGATDGGSDPTVIYVTDLSHQADQLYVDFSGADSQQALAGPPLTLNLKSAGGLTIVTRVVFKRCCADDPDFADAQGKSCSSWRGYDCSSYQGYSQAERAQVQSACAASCNLCAAPISTCDRSQERILDLGNGPEAHNVFLSRHADSSSIAFVVMNGENAVCNVVTEEDVIEEDAWMTLAVRFDAAANTIDILKDGRQIVDPTPCAVDGIRIDPADRYISLPLVGKSHWADDTASHIGLGGLVVVEGYLSEDEAMGAGNQLLEGTLSDELPHFDGTALAAHNVLYAAPSSGVRDSPADTCARPSFCKFPFTYQGRGYAQCTMHSNAGVFWYVFPCWLRTGQSSFLQA